MTPSKDLFELIKSMNSAEKGYIKKRTKVFHVNSQNLILFELIEKQREYNESEIRDRSMFSDNNKFAVAKNYLYHFILESLEVFYKNNPIQKTKSLLNSVEILSNKGLDEQAHKTLLKAKKLAQKFELKTELLEITNWEIKFLMNKNQSQEIFIQIQQQHNRFNENINRLKLEAESVYVYNYVRNKHLIIGMARAEEEIKEMNELLANIKIDKKQKHNTDFVKHYYQWFASSIYHFTNNDFKTTYQYALQIEALWDNNKHQIELHPNLYLNFLTRKMLFEDRLNYRDKVYKTILEGQKALALKHNFDVKTKSVFYIFTLGMYMQQADYKKCLKVISDIEIFKQSLANKMFSDSEEQLYTVTVADVYFEIGDYKKANSYLNTIFDKKLRYREDIYCFAHVKSILVHFEQKNYELLPYKIKSTLAFLRKQKRLHKTELLILNFIRNEIKTGNDITKKAYLQLKTQLEEILKDSFEKNILNYFDFSTWIDSKISRKSFQEIKLKKLE